MQSRPSTIVQARTIHPPRATQHKTRQRSPPSPHSHHHTTLRPLFSRPRKLLALLLLLATLRPLSLLFRDPSPLPNRRVSPLARFFFPTKMAPVLARCSALRCAATTRRPVAAVASRPSVCRRRSTVACRAELNQGPLANVQAQLDGFFKVRRGAAAGPAGWAAGARRAPVGGGLALAARGCRSWRCALGFVVCPVCGALCVCARGPCAPLPLPPIWPSPQLPARSPPPAAAAPPTPHPQRYDVLSCGAGALFVTSYCVFARGQDAWTALSITFTSTVVALVSDHRERGVRKHTYAPRVAVNVQQDHRQQPRCICGLQLERHTQRGPFRSPSAAACVACQVRALS